MTAPYADAHDVFTDIANHHHIMIAGASGSGKSVVEGGIIYNLANQYDPDEVEFWFIDPKKTELVKYECLPHVRYYADNDADASLLLDLLAREMDRRNAIVQADIRSGRTMSGEWSGKAIYCFIDETSDLIARVGKEANRKFQIIVQMGRSAGIHMVFCTQNVKRKQFPTEVQCNIDCVVGLKVRKPLESRMICDSDACAKLPPHGKAVLVTPLDEDVVDIPMYTPMHYKTMLAYWAKQRAAERR